MRPGSLGGWLLAYVRMGAEARVARRRGWAAWRTRRWGGSAAELVSRYQAEVRAGARAVARRNEAAWWRWCGRAVSSAVHVHRRGGVVMVVGGGKRDRQRIMQRESVHGEVWRTGDEPTQHGVESRQGAKRMRLTEKAMTRVVHGLDEPFGDG